MLFRSDKAAFSISFWFRPRALQPAVPVRLTTSSGEFSLYLGTQPGDRGGFTFGFSGAREILTTEPRTYLNTNLGCWMHVTLVYLGGTKTDASSFRAYYNGNPVLLAAGNAIPAGAGGNYLGRNLPGYGSKDRKSTRLNSSHT